MKADSAVFRRLNPANYAEQAANSMRDAIRCNVWGEMLPNEFELSRRLGVGRSTLRAALQQLAKDGLVEISKGRRTRVCFGRGRSLSNAPLTVCVISPYPRRTLAYIHQDPLLLEIRAELSEKGIRWEELYDSRLTGKNAGRHLERLVANRHRVCWLLVRTTAAVQRWFDASGVPALVFGHCHSGVNLPSVDSDYRAIGWHAAGRIAQMGHQHALFIMPHPSFAGDFACRDGFSDYWTQRTGTKSLTEISGRQLRSASRRQIAWVLGRNPRPTAVFATHALDAINALIYLLQSGRRIPADISLVSAASNILLDEAALSVARYQSNILPQAHNVVRLAQRIMTGFPQLRKPSLTVPAFIAGATLGRPPSHPDANGSFRN